MIAKRKPQVGHIGLAHEDLRLGAYDHFGIASRDKPNGASLVYVGYVYLGPDAYAEVHSTYTKHTLYHRNIEHVKQRQLQVLDTRVEVHVAVQHRLVIVNAQVQGWGLCIHSK